MVRDYKRKTTDRWSKDDLFEALTLIKENKCKINHVAQQFGISRATLYRHYNKFQKLNYDIEHFRTLSGSGSANQILSKLEEDVLEKVIIDLRTNGFKVSSNDIKKICFEYCDSNGISNQFNQEKKIANHDWYCGFVKRHPNILPKYFEEDDDDTMTEDCADGSKRPKKRKIGNAKLKKCDFIRTKRKPWGKISKDDEADLAEVLQDIANSSPLRKIESEFRAGTEDESELFNENMADETNENIGEVPTALPEGSSKDKEPEGFAHEEEATKLTIKQEEEYSILEVKIVKNENNLKLDDEAPKEEASG